MRGAPRSNTREGAVVPVAVRALDSYIRRTGATSRPGAHLKARIRWVAIGAGLLGTLVAGTLSTGFTAFGQAAAGARLARMQRSPQWKDGRFHNPQPLVNDVLGSLSAALHASPHASPAEQLVPEAVDPHRFDTPPATGLRITWLGHASTLIEIDGARVLTDPMWSDRSSPFTWLGPRRWYTPPIALAELPPLDAVVISHDHYDHLDHRSIVALKDRETTFIVPLGVGAHLAYWGVPESRIVELDWWELVKVGPVEVACTPARHASGRMLVDNDATLWAGFALLGARHRVYFSGDTGMFPALHDIGARYGPFDVTMIETGQYHAAWPDWHIGPERAVEAHQRVRGRVMLPVHWALLTLAFHGWTEPVERVLAAAARRGTRVLTPRPGQSVEPDDRAVTAQWWPALPWLTVEQDPLTPSSVL